MNKNLISETFLTASTWVASQTIFQLPKNLENKIEIVEKTIETASNGLGLALLGLSVYTAIKVKEELNNPHYSGFLTAATGLGIIMYGGDSEVIKQLEPLGNVFQATGTAMIMAGGYYLIPSKNKQNN